MALRRRQFCRPNSPCRTTRKNCLPFAPHGAMRATGSNFWRAFVCIRALSAASDCWVRFIQRRELEQKRAKIRSIYEQDESSGTTRSARQTTKTCNHRPPSNPCSSHCPSSNLSFGITISSLSVSVSLSTSSFLSSTRCTNVARYYYKYKYCGLCGC